MVRLGEVVKDILEAFPGAQVVGGGRLPSYRLIARQRWSGAEWIKGDGPFALVASCYVVTVSLHHSLEAAEKQKGFIDRFGCGGRCSRGHEIVDLTTPKTA